MKTTLLSALVMTLLLGHGPLAQAKDNIPVLSPDAKSVAVLSLSGYDKVLSDVAFFGQLAQQPGLEKQAEAMITLFTQGQGLAGLDKKRPWGVVVNTDGMGFQPLAFLPVENLKQLLEALAGLVGPADDAGDDILVVEKNNLKYYIKEQTGWAFVAQNPDHLSNLPADPAQWLDGLDKQYEVALRFNVQNVPEMYRTFVVDQLKAAVAAGMQPQPGEDETAFEQREKMVKNQIKNFEDVINQTDQITIGWALDQKAKSTRIDLSMTGAPGTEVAKKFSSVKDTTSSFSGFVLPKSAVTLNVTQPIDKSDADGSIQALETFKVSVDKEIETSDDIPDDETRNAAKEIVGEVFDAVKTTVASGKVDAGASLALGAKTFSLVAGAYIAEPGELDKALHRMAQVAAKDSKFPAIKFDAAKHGDVRFHTFAMPIPQDKGIAQVLGEKIDVAIGFGPQSVYVGAGTDCLSQLKKSIDGSKSLASKKIPPVSLNVALQPIFEFASQIDDNPANGALAGELAKAPGKDHVLLVGKAIKNGFSYRLEVQEGVLNLLGVAGKMAAGGPQPLAVPAPGR